MEIQFLNKQHKEFYTEYLKRCRYNDAYHRAFIYCLGISRDTREHVNQIYDFKTGCVKTKCLSEGWQTSGSMKVVRLAFNLYCNDTPGVYDYDHAEQQVEEFTGISKSTLIRAKRAAINERKGKYGYGI